MEGKRDELPVGLVFMGIVSLTANTCKAQSRQLRGWFQLKRDYYLEL
jgi:hypothetical protein